MNGEVKAYRLNDPMTWAEFKALPEDLQEVYVKGLRSRFGVSDTKIGEMFGMSQNATSVYFKKKGLALGKGANNNSKFKSEDWFKWCHGIKTDRVEEDCDVPNPVEEITVGEQDMNEPEKKVEGLTAEQKEIIHRALGRIEGVGYCASDRVMGALMLSIQQISEALGLIVEEEV